MRMLCYKCNHPWNYKGKKTEGTDYITCPGCLYKLRLDKALIGGPSKQELLSNLPSKKLLPNELPKKLPTTIDIKPVHTHLFNLSDLKEIEEETPMSGECVIIREIKSDIIIREIPPKTPLEIYEHQAGFF